MRSMTFADTFRVLLPAKAIWGANFKRTLKNCVPGSGLNLFGGHVTWSDLLTWPDVTSTNFLQQMYNWSMKRYAKFCYVAPLGLQVIGEKLQRGQIDLNQWPGWRLKGPSHLRKRCYIRGGCVQMNKFDATDYESALRFSENCLVSEKSSFEFLNYCWLHDVILMSF